MKKTLLGTATFGIMLLLSASLALLWNNNRESAWPDAGRIRTAFDASIAWIDANRDAIQRQGNPVLWWMIQRSAEITGDPILVSAFDQYRQSRLEVGRNPWLPLHFPGRWAPFSDDELRGFKDYQLHFLYAVSCDPDLGQRPIVQAQMDPAYCSSSPLRPACVTHQLMGFRFMQQNGCGDAQATARAVTELQGRVRAQLTWDPRVIDVYLQRVLMLVESGAADSIKPIWLERLLNAQNRDGGWDGVDPLIPLPGGKWIAFDESGLASRSLTSNFHATAQGILILSLLLPPADGADALSAKFTETVPPHRSRLQKTN